MNWGFEKYKMGLCYFISKKNNPSSEGFEINFEIFTNEEEIIRFFELCEQNSFSKIKFE